jgi:hypothetical protein
MPKGWPRRYWYKNRWEAGRRGLEFELNPQEFIELVKTACFFCGNAPTRLASAYCGKSLKIRNLKSDSDFRCHGLDRIDNERGYVAGNVVPCCWECNRIKSTLSIGGLLCHLPRMLVGLTNFVSHLKNLRELKPSISATDILVRVSRQSEYELVFCTSARSTSGEEVAGRVSSSSERQDLRINIRASTQIEETLIHEIGHAELWEGGFRQRSDWDADVEEQIVETIASVPHVPFKA